MRYPLLDDALAAAVEWHRGQEREGDDPLPYAVHPIEVVAHLRSIGGVTDERLLVAAALHDVIEACGVEAETVAARFGEPVSALVVELTRHEPGPEETQGLDKEGIWALRSHILRSEIAAMSPEAQTIKLADRLSNLREAKRTKKGRRLDRYVRQSYKILGIIPKSVNPRLWNAVKDELED